jgi:hypothetical protein
MILFRVRYMNTPSIPHVYCRVFVATDSGHYASVGNLTMRRDEFAVFRVRFEAEFVKDEGSAV